MDLTAILNTTPPPSTSTSASQDSSKRPLVNRFLTPPLADQAPLRTPDAPRKRARVSISPRSWGRWEKIAKKEEDHSGGGELSPGEDEMAQMEAEAVKHELEEEGLSSAFVRPPPPALRVASKKEEGEESPNPSPHPLIAPSSPFTNDVDVGVKAEESKPKPSSPPPSAPYSTTAVAEHNLFGRHC